MPRRHLPIQVYLAALFALVTLLIGLGSAFIFYDRMKRASLDTASQSFAQISAAIAQRVLQIRFEVGYRLAVAAGTSLGSAPDFAARVAGADALWPLLDASPVVLTAYVAYPNGDFLLLRPIRASDKLPKGVSPAYVLRSVDRSGGKVRGGLQYFDRDRQPMLRRDDPAFSFDPRTRPWFAAGTNDVSITDPYLFFPSKHVGFTIAQRAQAQSVFAVDIDMDVISRDLAGLRPTPSALAVVTDVRGVIVTTTNPEQLDGINRRLNKPATVYDLGLPALSNALNLARERPGEQLKGTFLDDRGRR
jgi:hypothetical protein